MRTSRCRSPFKAEATAGYALLREIESGSAFLSLPVSNRLCGYGEYYRLTEEELSQMATDAEAAINFARKCGRREMDDRLLLPPGSDRGGY